MSKKTSIGGQALIEGIMMKGPNKTALCVRGPSGQIITEFLEESAKPLPAVLKLPVIRGVVNFIRSMLQGYKALMRSADLSGMTELEDAAEREKAAEKRANKAAKKAKREGCSEEEVLLKMEQARAEEPEKKDDSALLNTIMVIAMVLGFGLAIVLFMYLPSWIFDGINSLFKGAISPLKTVIEGVLKIAIFVVYIILVSKTKDIRRVFMYHGAEHKTIFCYEAGEELTVENAMRQRRFHPRCGTSFLIIMLVVGILISLIISEIFPALTLPANRLLWVGAKLLMIPIICGLSYELIRICGRYDNVVTRIISAPGTWLQHITTQEPDESMLEIAISALRQVLPENPDDDNWG